MQSRIKHLLKHFALVLKAKLNQLKPFVRFVFHPSTLLPSPTYRIIKGLHIQTLFILLYASFSCPYQGKTIAGHCAAALLFDNLGIAQGRRVALHPFLKPVVKSCIGTDEKAVIDGNFYTAQNENTISCLLPELLKVLK